MTGKPPVIVAGMWGVGDVIHQRAVLRDLMARHEVWLETFNAAAYHDLIDQGLKIRLLTMLQPRMRESTAIATSDEAPPAATPRCRMTYNKATIEQYGSILAAQFACCGLPLPATPDFSLPIPQDWTDRAQRLIATWDMRGKPLLMYRPIVLNNVWRCASRSPDPAAYGDLYRTIRKSFFAVSFADLQAGKEWLIGEEPDADVRLHSGELDFETMAALFAAADLVFANPGFAPVLAQAVGTPVIVVYGGHESSATTQRTGAHLAPSLFIEPDQPCDCHLCDHECDKRITMAPARRRVREFVAAHTTAAAQTLIFATTYVDTGDKAKLLEHWLDVTLRLNPDCDVLLVDSHSPRPLPAAARCGRVSLYEFPDNIGHLARGGRDGWGRAFCHGLAAAIAGGYEYVVHIEGDSLFRLPVAPIVQQMRREAISCASIHVAGTRLQEQHWVETGLLFLRTRYVADAKLIERYDWQHRTPVPTPEAVIAKLLGDNLHLMPWRGERNDRNHITVDNVTGMDWITHCSDAAVYERFVAQLPVPASVKLNFGCGENLLAGWDNHDADVDISKPLPYPDNHADYIFTEHCMEHIDYYAAVEFLRECRRVLRPNGILRIATPSIERIWHSSDHDYFRFTTKWQPDATARGAMHAIMYCHGHRSVWTESLLSATMYAAGFARVTARRPGESTHAELRGVEGHQRVIGEQWNNLETIVCEGEADK